MKQFIKFKIQVWGLYWDTSDTFEAVGGLNLQQLVNKKLYRPAKIYSFRWQFLQSVLGVGLEAVVVVQLTAEGHIIVTLVQVN